MNTKVIIENSETEIILTPENDFEKDIIEKIHNNKIGFNLIVDFDCQTSYSIHSKHKITISIKEISQPHH